MLGAMADAQALTDKVLDLLLDAVVAVDVGGRFVFASAACERVFGYTPEEMIGREMLALVHPDDRERTLAAARGVAGGAHLPHFENRYLRKDGSVVDIMWTARWSADEQLRVAVARDITTHKRDQSLRTALYSISEAAHSTEDLNELFARIHGAIAALLPARNFCVALYDEARDELRYPYRVDESGAMPAPGPLASAPRTAEVIRTGKTLLVTPATAGGLPPGLEAGSAYWLGAPLSSHGGTFGALVVQGYAGGATYDERDRELLQFVSAQVAAAVERKRMHARLQHIALYDQLTDLPNRELLRDRLRTALARARREQGQLSLLYLDLDDFKPVNDVHGHAVGDALLREVARRLRASLRESDTVARLGGDEFVVLLEGLRAPGQAEAIAEKLRLALAQSILVDHLVCQISASIGVAVYPADGGNDADLLRHADAAMYRAKRAGGNRVVAGLDVAGDPGSEAGPVGRRG
jgi:diguanylate cyclase (GGDEF)-like protein/PAS domain S-box-containing protein